MLRIGSTLRAARRLLNRQLYFQCPDISCGHHRRFIRFNNFGNTSFLSTLSNNNSSTCTTPQIERAEENDSVGSDVLENHCSGSRVEGHALSEVEPVGRRLSDGTMDAYLDSVVKIFTVSSSPNYFLPWQNKSQRESSGSGFVIGGKRILTNAHVVADHTFVLVRKHGSPTKYRATVQAVGHECDLAILVVQSEEFWEGMNSLELGDVPFLQEAVSVVGYPQGGDNISVTKGVVSRVELTQYVHGASQLLTIQIDAAINPGNSGGPAIMGDKVAGVPFQNLIGAENIGSFPKQRENHI